VPTSCWKQIRWFAPNKPHRSYGELYCHFWVQWIGIIPFPSSYTVLLAVGRFFETGGGFSPTIYQGQFQGLVRHTKAARPATDDENTWRELSKRENFSTLTTLKNFAEKSLRNKKLWKTKNNSEFLEKIVLFHGTQQLDFSTIFHGDSVFHNSLIRWNFTPTFSSLVSILTSLSFWKFHQVFSSCVAGRKAFLDLRMCIFHS